MPAGQLQQTVQHIRRLAGSNAQSLSDQQLLECFAASRDENAFAILVERHSPLVLGVCRRVLAHNQDAEDACQAAFLVLARKAGSIRKGNSLRCWLHGVAFRVASNLRKQRLRRPAGPLVEPAAMPEDISWREVQRILDEELLRLPEHFRLPLMLCYLEGKTRDEAAEELGWSPSTFRGRLERGRERLRKRLESKGVGLTAGLLAAMLSQAGEPIAVSSALYESLLQTTIPANSSEIVRSLAEGAMSGVNAISIKIGAAVFLVLGLLGVGIVTMQNGSPPIALPAAAAREVDKDPPRKDPAAKPLTEKELATTAAKCRDAAIEWLKKNQGKDGGWDHLGNASIAWKGGPTSLVVAALADSGIEADDPLLARALKHLRELKPSQTYVVSLQTLALCRVNDKQDAALISRNVEWLVKAGTSPNVMDQLSWSYTVDSAGSGDFSNTQFALMALHEADRVGIKPRNTKVWENVRKMCLSSQLVDGGWGYRTGSSPSTFAMTCAGLNALYLADENIGSDTAASRNARKIASAYLARKYAPFDGLSAFYNLDLIARLGKLTGEKKIGDHDWYAEGVQWILKHQNADGSISAKNSIDGIRAIATPYAILFLNFGLDKK